jgi:hypothetical protein
MIYVDDAGIVADVPNRETGKTVSSTWCHLISDQLDPTELHHFATKILGLRKSYFQPGKVLGNRDHHDPGGDHYDLTEGKRKQAVAQGATPVTAEELGVITRRKRLAYRGIPDIQVIAERLGKETGRFAMSFTSDGWWAAAIEWGQEVDNSPIAGAAAYSVGRTAREAIEAVIQEAGWKS